MLRGEKSFPVMLTTFTCIHKETKEKIKYDDYKNLSEDEKKEYNVYPRMQVFRVFNVQQTNLRKRVRNCGKSWKRKTAVLKSRQANSSTSSRWTG